MAVQAAQYGVTAENMTPVFFLEELKYGKQTIASAMDGPPPTVVGIKYAKTGRRRGKPSQLRGSILAGLRPHVQGVSCILRSTYSALAGGLFIRMPIADYRLRSTPD